MICVLCRHRICPSRCAVICVLCRYGVCPSRGAMICVLCRYGVCPSRCVMTCVLCRHQVCPSRCAMICVLCRHRVCPSRCAMICVLFRHRVCPSRFTMICVLCRHRVCSSRCAMIAQCAAHMEVRQELQSTHKCSLSKPEKVTRPASNVDQTNRSSCPWIAGQCFDCYMVQACHTPRRPLQNHHSGHLGGWARPWSVEEMLDGQHQRVGIPAHARTAHKGLLLKRLEEDLC